MWQARVSVAVVCAVLVAGLGGYAWVSGYRSGVGSAGRLCGGFGGASAAARQSLGALVEALQEAERLRSAGADALDREAGNDSETLLCGLGAGAVDRLRVSD